eukprot:11999876-Ditylum_brightwellii.AAC.1
MKGASRPHSLHSTIELHNQLVKIQLTCVLLLQWWCMAVLEVVVCGRSCGGGAWPFLGGVRGRFFEVAVGSWQNWNTSEERVAVFVVGGPVLLWSACGEREVHQNSILF